MGVNTNIEKNRQLGCSYASANTKLTRMILFDLSKKFGLDICFRCGLHIASFKEFSIDHKQPWLYVSVSLFWDLNNIAFSHRKCNTSVRRSRKRVWVPKSDAFMKWYAIPENARKWNKRRRELYAIKKTAASSNGQESGLSSR